jgi:hypothetical protein
MARHKVFMGCIDGKNQKLIKCSNKKRAAELIGVSLASFNDFFSECADDYSQIAENPDVVYWRPINVSTSTSRRWLETKSI